MTDDLEDLSKRVEQARQKSIRDDSTEPPEKTQAREETRRNMRAAVELKASIIAGGVIGWLLDKAFDTSPLFLLIFIMVGIGAGFYNLYKISVGAGSAIGYKPLHDDQKGVKQNSEK